MSDVVFLWGLLIDFSIAAVVRVGWLHAIFVWQSVVMESVYSGVMEWPVYCAIMVD